MKSVQRKAALLAVFAMMAVSLVNAQEEEGEESAEGAEAAGIGLTPGIEFGFGNVVDKVVFSVTPLVVYENSFGDLDVFGELDYTMAFEDPDAVHELYIEEELGYNFGIIESGTLSIILNNNNTIQVAPELEEGATHLGTFEPSLKWTQGLGFGDLWLQVGLPIDYLTGVEEETALGLNTTLGWDSTFGLAAEFALGFGIDPESDLLGYGLKLSYDAGLIYGEVELAADKEFKVFGIAPELDVNLGSLTIYAKAEIVIIEDVDDPIIEPAIGVTYSF
jgi:hypothetical protein